MHVKQLGLRLSESVLVEIIISILLGLGIMSNIISSKLIYTACSLSIFLLYIFWTIVALRVYARRTYHKSTYFLTNGIVFAIIAVPSITLAAMNAIPYYYFLFCPFASFFFLGLGDLLLSTIMSNVILLLCYIICPYTVRRKRRKKHNDDDGPIDTNHFIMKV